MLEVSKIKALKQNVLKALKKRGFTAFELVDKVLELDALRISKQQILESTLNQLNTLTKEIELCFKNKELDKAKVLKEKHANIKLSSSTQKDEYTKIINQLNACLLQIPNTPHESVPFGNSEEDNEIVYENKLAKQIKKTKNKPHWDIASQYNIVDFELGVKLTKSGFPLFVGQGAKLVRGLINFFLDEATNAGYNECIPPLMVNEDSALATGQLPDKEGQMYHIQKDNLYLIPTAEVPLTNIYRNTNFKTDELPKKLTAYSQCFRREAGSYGKDVRGLNRLHQFDKVEIVQICKPQDSYKILDNMVDHVKLLLDKLELPYRILRLCGKDIGFTSALTYDFEVYSMAQERWLEVSSVSNFETYQANRLNCKFKNEHGKKEYLHTLNGSALALPRVIAALLENNQTNEGIIMPKAIQSYVGLKYIS